MSETFRRMIANALGGAALGGVVLGVAFVIEKRAKIITGSSRDQLIIAGWGGFLGAIAGAGISLMTSLGKFEERLRGGKT